MIELNNGLTFDAIGCAVRDGVLWMYLQDVIQINDVIVDFSP